MPTSVVFVSQVRTADPGDADNASRREALDAALQRHAVRDCGDGALAYDHAHHLVRDLLFLRVAVEPDAAGGVVSQVTPEKSPAPRSAEKGSPARRASKSIIARASAALGRA